MQRKMLIVFQNGGICCGQALVPTRPLWDWVTGAESQQHVNSHTYWACYCPSFHHVLDAPAAELAVWIQYKHGRVSGRPCLAIKLTSAGVHHLCSSLTDMENTLPHIPPSLSRTSLSVSHKSVQSLSALVNNKWRALIEYLAKRLSVSLGRTLVQAEGLWIEKVTLSEYSICQQCLLL